MFAALRATRHVALVVGVAACVPHPEPTPRPVGLVESSFAEPAPITFELGGPAADAGCRRCTAVFELEPLRTLLATARVREAVTLRLLDRGGLPLAELGSYTPGPDGAWSALPQSVNPALTGRLPDRGGCGYLVEIASNETATQVRRPVCLAPR